MLKNNFLRIYTNKPNGFLTLELHKYFTAILPFGYAFACLLLFAAAAVVSGNEGNKNSADMNLRSSGRVNPSTLGMELDIPLGGYSGRGISIPINLSYSSKLWRLKYGGIHAEPGQNEPSGCAANYEAYFSEDAAAGWTTSMATPYIEYTEFSTRYDIDGQPNSGSSEDCVTNEGGGSGGQYYLKRIMVRLPGGETHELRADDSAFINDYNNPYNMNGVYYAVDGSNIKYTEDSTANPAIYRLQMPDGSFYDFGGSIQELSRRKAVKFTDRNGNFTSYFAPGSVDDQGVTHPNGYWKDTLGRNISVPIGLKAPTAPTTAPSPQTYKMPGMTGEYKLHWKKLNGGTQAESALTDITNPNYQLKYVGDTYLCTVNGIEKYCKHPAGSYLFSTDGRVFETGLFNPVVLSEIELPTGQKYKFTYDVYGRIEKIIYPTGGVETFEFGVVSPLSKIDDTDPNKYANFGVKKRRVYQTAGQGTPYEWTYEAFYTEPAAYVVRTTNPDNTKSERYLHRGKSDAALIRFGYESVLAGMPYEERGFDKTGTLVSKKLTYWTKSVYQVNPGNLLIAERQPRVAQEKSFIYDSTGNGVSATVIYEYEGNVNTDKTTPVLLKKSTQYAFETVSGGSSISMSSSTCDPNEEICEPPLPTPSPSPTPLPTPSSAKVRIAETTYLINDTSYPEWVKDIYKAQNMIGLATASVIKDGAETIVSRSEMKYDDGSSSPNIGRGNPTSLRVWDNMRGNWDNPNAYITTYAKFDQWGNQYETTDAEGNTTSTVYDSIYHAYPIQVTSAVPDPTNTNGSNTAFVTTATYDTVTGLPLTTTDANGLEARIEYDPATLRPLRTKTYFNNSQVGSEAETIYHDEAGNYWIKNRAQIDVNKWAESITYFDGLGRAYKAEEVNSEGNIFVEKEFDAEGRVKRVTNPFRANETKQWTTNIYDNASRVIEVVTPDGAKVTTDYSVAISGTNIGTLVTVTDQAGKQRRSITNALGQLTRVDEPDDSGNPGSVSSPVQPTNYNYDILNNLTTVTQGVQMRTFGYDSLSRLKQATNPESGTISYTYDNNGNLQTRRDARGIKTIYDYDGLNRVVKRCYRDIGTSAPLGMTTCANNSETPEPNTPDIAYFYDNLPNAKGKLTKVTNGFSTTEYQAFDILGRITQSQQTTDGTVYDSMTYTYNLSGAMVEQKYPSGRVVKNVLDNDGDLSIVESKKNVADIYRIYANSFTYTAAGAVSSLRLGNGKFENTQFNSRLQPVQIGLGSSATNQNLLKLNFDYGTTNNNGNVLSQTITVPTEVRNNQAYSGFTATQTYTYDSLNRLKDAKEMIGTTQQWKQTFTYDRYGNRNFDEANTTTIPVGCAVAVCNPQIDPATNKLVGYTFDNAGNTQTDANGRQFIYDGENKQVEVKDTYGVSIGKYFYDGDGKRVKKISNTETTIFVYNAGGQLVAEYSTQISQQPQVGYLTTDHLGSPRINTDQNGAVIARHDYQPFGEEIQRASYGADTVRKQFTGYERDKETDLDYAKARMFESGFGRFTSPDPLMASAKRAIPQSWNRYAYVLNNPHKYVDPSGMVWGYKDLGNGRSAFCYAEGEAVCKGFTAIKGDAIVEDFTINDKSVGAVRLLPNGEIERVVAVDIPGNGRSWLNQKDADAINQITGGALCSLSAGLACPNAGGEIADNVQTAADITQMVFVLKSLLKAGLSLAAIAAVLKTTPDDIIKQIPKMSTAQLSDLLALQKNEIKALLKSKPEGARESLALLESGKIPAGAENITRQTLEAYRQIAINAIKNPKSSAYSIEIQMERLKVIDKMVELLPQ